MSEAEKVEKPGKVAVKVKDYTELVQVLDARRRQLGMRMADLDYTYGLQEGYAAKLICGMKTLGPVSLPLMLQTLGMEILVTLDRLGLQLLVAEKRPLRPCDVKRRERLSAISAGRVERHLSLPKPEGTSP
jgi:hypothetical protein